MLSSGYQLNVLLVCVNSLSSIILKSIIDNLSTSPIPYRHSVSHFYPTDHHYSWLPCAAFHIALFLKSGPNKREYKISIQHHLEPQ